MTSKIGPVTLRKRDRATTWTLVEDVAYAARRASRNMVWPRKLSRSDAKEIVHAYAAEFKYQEDRGIRQVIKMPGALVEVGKGDCKSTAVLCASLLSAAGCAVQLKFLQYTEDRPWWEHVYCVADGVAVDPLLPIGKEFPYLRCHIVDL